MNKKFTNRNLYPPEDDVVRISHLITCKIATEKISLDLGNSVWSPQQLRLAMLCEVGEVLQEVKKYFAWWSREKSWPEVDKGKLALELADIMHFYFLGVAKLSQGVGQRVEQTNQALLTLETPWDREWENNIASLHAANFASPGTFMKSLFVIAKEFGITRQEVIDAFYDKTHINLSRWEQALIARETVTQKKRDK